MQIQTLSPIRSTAPKGPVADDPITTGQSKAGQGTAVVDFASVMELSGRPAPPDDTSAEKRSDVQEDEKHLIGVAAAAILMPTVTSPPVLPINDPALTGSADPSIGLTRTEALITVDGLLVDAGILSPSVLEPDSGNVALVSQLTQTVVPLAAGSIAAAESGIGATEKIGTPNSGDPDPQMPDARLAAQTDAGAALPSAQEPPRAPDFLEKTRTSGFDLPSADLVGAAVQPALDAADSVGPSGQGSSVKSANGSRPGDWPAAATAPPAVPSLIETKLSFASSPAPDLPTAPDTAVKQHGRARASTMTVTAEAAVQIEPKPENLASVAKIANASRQDPASDILSPASGSTGIAARIVVKDQGFGLDAGAMIASDQQDAVIKKRAEKAPAAPIDPTATSVENGSLLSVPWVSQAATTQNMATAGFNYALAVTGPLAQPFLPMTEVAIPTVGSPIANPSSTNPPIGVQVAAAISDRPGLIELTLSPEELGRIRFEIQQDGDLMRMVLTAERPETLEHIRRHLPEFLSDLRQSGFNGSDVSLGQWTRGSNGGDGSGGWAGNGGHGAGEQQSNDRAESATRRDTGGDESRFARRPEQRNLDQGPGKLAIRF